MSPKKNNKKIPSLQFAVLCEGVTDPSSGGKFSLVGIFDKIIKPGVLPHFSLVLRWIDGKGTFKVGVKLLDPDLNPKIEIPPIQIKLEHPARPSNNIINMKGTLFSSPGVHWIEVLLDQETVLSIPLPVGEE